MGSLLKELWNSPESDYLECGHPLLQRIMDSIKNIYIHSTAKKILLFPDMLDNQDLSGPSILEVDMSDISLQRRVTNYRV